MSIESDGSVQHEVLVDLPPAEAFSVFADLDQIKPREHNLLSAPIEETVLEPWAGGDVYDRGIDGSVCRWGRVLVYDPPYTLSFTWDIGPDWQIATDLAATSEVEVTFTPESDGRTRVRLVHSHIDRHGRGWESLRDGLEEPEGWALYLSRFESLARAGRDAP